MEKSLLSKFTQAPFSAASYAAIFVAVLFRIYPKESDSKLLESCTHTTHHTPHTTHATHKSHYTVTLQIRYTCGLLPVILFPRGAAWRKERPLLW